MYRVLGVDIGKDVLHVCAAYTDQNPCNWKVYRLNYADSDWHEQLIRLVAPNAIVTAEPTGYHYLQPLVTVLSWIPGVQMYQVSHHVTGQVRGSEIADSKTDDMDARALAIIAARVMNDDSLLGVRRYLPEREDKAQELRLFVNTHRRLTKDTTRLRNQLDTLGHSLWPTLATYKETWLKCVALGAVSPIEIKTLADSAHPALNDGRSYRYIRDLADRLPNVDGSLQARAFVISLNTRLIALEDEKDEIMLQLTAMIEAEPFAAVTSRWRTVPGMGDIWIAALHVATRGQADLLTRDEFKTAVGVNPHTQHSSTIHYSGKKKRKGYKPAMVAMYMVTNHLLRRSKEDNSLKRYMVSHKYLKRPAAACRRKLGDILSAIAQRPDGLWRD